MKNLGTRDISIRVVLFGDQHFNAKVAFPDLEQILVKNGVQVRGIETRESGRGTPFALRAVLTRPEIVAFNAAFSIGLVNHDDTHFNATLVLEGREQALQKKGFIVQECETRLNGDNTPLAIRVRL